MSKIKCATSTVNQNTDKNGFYALFTPSKMKNGNRKLEHFQDFIQYFIQMNFNMSSKLYKIQLESARAFIRETILNCDIGSFIHLKNLFK